MNDLAKNALEIVAVTAIAGFCVQWTLLGLDTPKKGFAEMKRAALVVDASPDVPLSGPTVERLALVEFETPRR